MPRLLLHTGLHKTGTTTIQRALHENMQVLAQQGFLYPTTGLTDNQASWGHHDLAYALRREAHAREVWGALRTEADSAGLPHVIVSSEELSLLPFPSLPALRSYKIISEIFAGYDITLICYLRPQADMAASLYNHHVKSTGETRDIIDFLPHVAPRLDYMQYLHVAATALGDSAIKVRRYGPQWLRGDVLEDLAQEIGLDLGHGFERPKTDLNPGLTAQGLAMMLKANARLADDPAKLKKERQRLLDRYKARPFESCDMLSPDTRRTIQALFRYKNIQIGHRFMGLDGDAFDPDVKPLIRPGTP